MATLCKSRTFIQTAPSVLAHQIVFCQNLAPVCPRVERSVAKTQEPAAGLDTDSCTTRISRSVIVFLLLYGSLGSESGGEFVGSDRVILEPRLWTIGLLQLLSAEEDKGDSNRSGGCDPRRDAPTAPQICPSDCSCSVEREAGVGVSTSFVYREPSTRRRGGRMVEGQ